MASPSGDEPSLADAWPELGESPCSTDNLRLWSTLDPEQYAARNEMLLAAVQKHDSPENIFRSVQILFGTWEEEGFYEPMRKQFPDEFACWGQYVPICSATDLQAPDMRQSPCSPRNLARWSVVTTEEYDERNTRIRLRLLKQETPMDLLKSVYDLMCEFENKDFIGPMRERWSAAFDALNDGDPMLEGRSPLANVNMAGPSSHDVPSHSSMVTGHIGAQTTSEASQLAILRAGGWTPSTRAKRKRDSSMMLAGRTSGSAASTGDATDSAVARK